MKQVPSPRDVWPSADHRAGLEVQNVPVVGATPFGPPAGEIGFRHRRWRRPSSSFIVMGEMHTPHVVDFPFGRVDGRTDPCGSDS